MRRGAKTKLTPETQKMICDALSMGAPVCLACDYVGITEETYYYWLRRAAKGEPLYSAFSEAVQKTQGRAAVGWLAKIETAASDGNWQAAAWKLERRYPQEFGRRDRLDVNITLVQQLVGRVAEEMGLTVAEVLGEAQALLKEGTSA